MFRLSEAGTLMTPLELELIYGIWLQISMDQTLIQRNGYTMLDVLSDVGGLLGILISGISFILSISNHNNLNNYLVSKLFKSNSVVLTASQTDSIKEYCLIKCLP